MEESPIMCFKHLLCATILIHYLANALEEFWRVAITAFIL